MTYLKSGQHHYWLDESLLGKGQFGKVRKGTCLVTGETFACKTVEAVGETVYLPEREVTRLRDMADCQHVIKLHEAFTEAEHLNIVTEFCAGGTLADKVETEGPLPRATAAKFLEALAHFANDCIHKGIWHNDIKPENILLISTHPDSDLKVADFGFARTHQYCMSGQVILGYGTKGYMAPEVEQQEWHSHQSEMYSIGAVIYFVLCGEDHFHFDDGAITLKPLDSSKKWAALDQDAKDILESLLHDLPERRLTASQLLHKPWLYAAQGKPFPDEPIFAPAVSTVPLHISHAIQRRKRHTQLLPVRVDPFRAHVDIQAQQAKQHMAGQPGGPHSTGHAGQAEAVMRRLHPYPHRPPLASTMSDSAARAFQAPLAAQADLLAAASSAAAAAEAYESLSVEDRSDRLAHEHPSAAAAAAAAVASHSFYTAAPKPKPLDLSDRSLYPYFVVPKWPDAPNARPPLLGSAPPCPSAAPPAASHSFLTAAPKPRPLDRVDAVPYPYSVMPKRPPATEAKQHGPAAPLPFAFPAHGRPAFADCESLIHSQSRPASESLTGSTIQSESESPPSELYPASECSSLVTHGSPESFARSEDSSSIAHGGSLDSTSADSDMRSDVELGHDMPFDFAIASVAESGGSRWRHKHQTQKDTYGRSERSFSFDAFPMYTHRHKVLRQRTASPLAELTETEVAPWEMMQEEEGAQQQQHRGFVQPADIHGDTANMADKPQARAPDNTHLLASLHDQVAPWPSMGVQMGGEQSGGPPTHHPHLLPPCVIAEGYIAEGGVVDGQEMATMRTSLAELQSKNAQQHQELMEEQSRRMAAESQIAGITAERDAYRQKLCEVLELKLKSTQRELNSTHCQVEQNQGFMRQPQSLAPGTDDMPHDSDAAKVNTGTHAAQRPYLQPLQTDILTDRELNSMANSAEGQQQRLPGPLTDQQVLQASPLSQENINTAAAAAGTAAMTTGEDDKVEMAEEAHVNVASALPQPSALDGGAQAAPRATKKRKRATDSDGQAPHHDTGGLQMSDNQAAAHGEEEPSRLQASAKRMRHMGADSPNDPIQGSAVSAAHTVHAEPNGSTIQSPQPAAAAARGGVRGKEAARMQPCVPVRRSKRLQELQQRISSKDAAL